MSETWKHNTKKRFFDKAVLNTYNYKCTFCRTKVTLSIKKNIVEEAYIAVRA